jgi:hypothetical protein
MSRISDFHEMIELLKKEGLVRDVVGRFDATTLIELDDEIEALEQGPSTTTSTTTFFELQSTPKERAWKTFDRQQGNTPEEIEIARKKSVDAYAKFLLSIKPDDNRYYRLVKREVCVEVYDSRMEDEDAG